MVKSASDDPDLDEDVVLGRGTQIGQLLPGDECKPWSEYENLVLDQYATISGLASMITLVCGGVILAVLVLAYPLTPLDTGYGVCFRATFQWTAVLAAVGAAVLQALTHFLVVSNLCGDSELLDAGYDCIIPTFSYNLTFANLSAWAVVAILVVDCSCGKRPCDDGTGGRREATEDEDDEEEEDEEEEDEEEQDEGFNDEPAEEAPKKKERPTWPRMMSF